MVAYKQIDETELEVVYEYYPENHRDDKGKVSISKKDGSISIIEYAPSDDVKIYIRKVLAQLRQFYKSGEYLNEGKVIWY